MGGGGEWVGGLRGGGCYLVVVVEARWEGGGV